MARGAWCAGDRCGCRRCGHCRRRPTWRSPCRRGSRRRRAAHSGALPGLSTSSPDSTSRTTARDCKRDAMTIRVPLGSTTCCEAPGTERISRTIRPDARSTTLTTLGPTRRRRRAVRAERGPPDDSSPGALDGVRLLPGRRVPDAGGPVVADGGEHGAVVVEGDLVDVDVVAGEGTHRLARPRARGCPPCPSPRVPRSRICCRRGSSRGRRPRPGTRSTMREAVTARCNASSASGNTDPSDEPVRSTAARASRTLRSGSTSRLATDAAASSRAVATRPSLRARPRWLTATDPTTRATTRATASATSWARSRRLARAVRWRCSASRWRSRSASARLASRKARSVWLSSASWPAAQSTAASRRVPRYSSDGIVTGRLPGPGGVAEAPVQPAALRRPRRARCAGGAIRAAAPRGRPRRRRGRWSAAAGRRASRARPGHRRRARRRASAIGRRRRRSGRRPSPASHSRSSTRRAAARAPAGNAE